MGINIYDPEEINELIKLLTIFIILVGGTSIGTFTQTLIFPHKNTRSKNFGFSLMAGFIAFGIYLRYVPPLSTGWLFFICLLLGFFTPAFEDWMKGKKILKLLVKLSKSASDKTSDIVRIIDEELDKEVD